MTGKARTQLGGGDEYEVFRAEGGVEGWLAVLAERQKGLITRRQLLRAGVPGQTIDERIAGGRFIRIHRGVYALGHLALPPFAPELAAVLAVGDDALASHGSAAPILRLRYPADPEDTTVHVTVPGRHRHSRPGITVHSTTTLHRLDVSIRHGVPVTSAARTVVDLAAAGFHGRGLERMVDEAIVEGIVTRGALAAAARRSARRPGARRVLELMEPGRPTTRTRSHPEERLLALCRRGGLPAPAVNARVGAFEVDFLWRAQRVAVEVDAFGTHATRVRFERDHRKDAFLRSVGIEPLRFTDVQIEDAPEVVLVTIARALARAAS